MNTIIDIEDYADRLRDIVIQVCLETHEVFEEKNTDWCGLIYLLFVDCVNDRMLWYRHKHYTEFDWEMKSHFDWFNPDKDNAATALLQTRIDQIWLDIINTLDSIIPSRTYTIYTVTRYDYDIIVTKGMDYRIADWERAVKTGKIEHPRRRR